MKIINPQWIVSFANSVNKSDRFSVSKILSIFHPNMDLCHAERGV